MYNMKDQVVQVIVGERASQARADQMEGEGSKRPVPHLDVLHPWGGDAREASESCRGSTYPKNQDGTVVTV
ncbi:hypothetical protein NHX12_010249 [Muraenolepis orangiensis]|uniref:Uncharacterized protein n=1 Tax=Muraenolepis orangiensis TaxID=630683 RepID=A0A9Q0I888_9TELE|nr:hypothetical protein NHX12_010249 [Muraenolepis orangiensis]